MKKNVGELYKGKINKKIDSIQDFYYSKKHSDASNLDDAFTRPLANIDSISEKVEKIRNYDTMTISEKIDYLLNLPAYLPDFIVEMKTKDEIIYTELDSRTNNEIITKNNTRIKIKDIEGIVINK